MTPVQHSTLCQSCAHLRIVRSERGSVFLRCALAKVDSRFSKYPPQPVLRCEGFRQQEPDSTPGESS